jgi:serine/threonine-protein kinase HipA
LFRRAVFAWLIADGDMHQKNLAMLKTAEVEAKAFTTVHFAPLYDAVNTRVYPGLGGDRMALKLNCKDDRLTRQDYIILARTIGLAVGDAEAAMSELAGRLSKLAKTLRLPAFAGEAEAARSARGKLVAIAVERCAGFGGANA